MTLSERKRVAIIDAAVREFQQAGFQAATMDKIAASAQVSKRTVYNHFPSKELLFAEITTQIFKQAMSATDFVYSSEMPLAEQLTLIAKQEMALLADVEYMNQVRMVIGECFHSFELVQQSLMKLKQTEGGLNKWLLAGVEDGRLVVPDTEMASVQFIGLLKSFAFWPQILTHQSSLAPNESEVVVNSAVEMFLKQYQK